MVNGLNGQQMLIGLLIGIVLLIFMVLKTKIQAFLALIITTVVIGVIGGMPLNTITLDNGTKFGILQSITSGFGNTLSSIGIIIGFGVMLGAIFEETGAAKRMALCFLKVFGKNKEEEAMAFTGFLVSIPIFCDSGFIILSPIAKAISKVTKKSLISLGVALAAGLVITHTMVPPTPGPLGVCGIFGIDVGEFILLALVLSIPMTIVAIIYARKYIAKKLNWIVNEKDEIVPAPVGTVASDDAINLDEKDLPSTFSSFLPILLPVVLILINTVSTATKMTGGIFTILIFLGQPIVAVGIGLLTAIFVLGRKMSRKEILSFMEQGMMSAGIIMLVTGGGGALGQIIKDSGLGTYMAEGITAMHVPIILLPILISTVMRFIQGSGTVAMTTAASISAPIILASGANPVLSALACCVGSCFFSYFNDSYFWVVNRTLGVSEAKDQIRVWSITTTIIWAVGCLEVLLLSLVMH
ncbi:MAG: GntP family permease [Lachnospiraceae bacterium]|nr:GntP family permease [Lachnospiraceae bacterium]